MANQGVQAALDEALKGTGVSGLVFAAIDKNGNYLAKNVAGNRGLNTTGMGTPSRNPGSNPMTLDSVFWIASCTKMITGIAAMQLAEKGVLPLDSSADLYKYVPELKDMKVIGDNGELVPRQGEITVRMLLAHTAGFGYSFFNPKVRDYSMPTGFDEFSGDVKDYLQMPLANQPGTAWEYGTNIDWAGIAVERASGLTLDNYFKKNIFEPLGIQNISFFPNEHMRENLVNAQQRVGDKTIDIDHPFRRPVWHADDKQREQIFNSGGAGCFAKPTEYCQILTALLNDGKSPTTGNRILSEASVNEMFKNQIPQFPNFARNPIPDAKPMWTNPLPELYPQEGNPPQGWGLTFMLTLDPAPTGRGAGTGWWAGIVNLFWWCDREKGVAGMIAGQILPFGDMTVMGAWMGAEKAVYDALKK